MNTSRQDNTRKPNSCILSRKSNLYGGCHDTERCPSIHTVSRNDPKVFANRALTRIRLSSWEAAEMDARKAIELYGEKNRLAMKAHYYLAQALLAQRHVGEAVKQAQYAYSICLDTRDSSAEAISQFILRAKQAQWQARETSRLREMNDTLATVETMLEDRLASDIRELDERHQRGEVGDTGRVEEREQLEQEAGDRRRNIREAFTNPLIPESAERVVPDYLIDTITFEIMHDPVVTPSGASYERVGLLKHLRAHGVDPLTRQPLTESQLYPNVALKNACSEFLENNGWAVDY